MAGLMNMLKTMMWKNYIVRKRHWFLTILEIIVPCCASWLLLYIYLNQTLQKFTVPAYYPEPYSLDSCFSDRVLQDHTGFVVGFSPNNTATFEIMNTVKDKIWKEQVNVPLEHLYFQQKYMIDFKPMNSEYELEDYFQKLNSNDSQLFYGVVFETYENSKEFKYKIRIGGKSWVSSFGTDSLQPALLPEGRELIISVYQRSCFLTLQKTLDLVFIEKMTKQKIGLNIKMSEFPYPEYTNSSNVQAALSIILPVIVIISFCLILPNIIKRVVEEKETGVKELMKMMGLRPWMVWIGWLVNANMINIFVTTFITIIFCGNFKDDRPALLPQTSPIIIWLLLILFMNAATVSLFVVCAFFHRPLIASSVGMCFYFLPFTILKSLMPTAMSSGMAPLWIKLLLSLLPTYLASEGFDIIFALNNRGNGVHWYNLFEKPAGEKNDLSMGLVFIMFVVDLFIYGTLTWYIDNVRPGPYGRAKPWYFIFNVVHRGNDDILLIPDDENDSVHFEPPPSDLNVGLSIRNLTKTFPPNVYAVNGVNIDIYKGQITALLGHNGAGKTTTMSILTGMYSPTSGTILKHISDTKCINIFDNMDEFRQDLGLCPQHNMLFPYFSVIEHLLFFGMLKGLTIDEARKSGHQLLQTLNILEKSNVKVDQLSGGMKRKLSLAISLIAEPKVLVLDEPTSGMDPESRREMWDILLNIREGRTIIITTHFMEEADVLGDRIAIMDHGKVRCYGTSMFLKKVYGAGYFMTLLTKPQADSNFITDIVRNSVPGSKLRSHHQGQLVYNLPTESSSAFASLFFELETRKSELFITSIGISCTTMEEVFLKVGEISEMEKNAETDKSSNNSHENQTFNRSTSTEYLSPKKVTGLRLFFQQFSVLFMKKIKFTYRRLWNYIFFTFLSVVMISVALRSSSPVSNSPFPPLKISSATYTGTEVLVTYVNKTAVDKYVQIYKNSIKDNIVKDISGGNIIDELMSQAKKNIERYRIKMVFASDWTGANSTVGFYSSLATHSSAVSLNAITNTILKALSVDKTSSIVVTNHPLTKFSTDPCSAAFNEFNTYLFGLTWAVTVPFGMLFVLANFIAFPLFERISVTKHLQLMTGLSPLTYWVAAYIWDYLLFLLTSFLFLIPIHFFDYMNIFHGAREIGVFYLIVNLYGFSGLLFAYFFSFLRKSPAGAPSAFIFYNTIFGALGSVVVTVLKAIGYLEGIKHTIINSILLLNPYYTVSLALVNFSKMAYRNALCDLCQDATAKNRSHCEENKALPFIAFESKEDPEGIALYLIMLFLDWFFYLALILFVDYGYFNKAYNYIQTRYFGSADIGRLDSDVQDERDRVDAVRENQGTVTAPVMVVDDLMKKYGKNFTAVRGISFAVSSGECFGLLGVNGAGKTTTFKMLTGDEIPTSGNASILSYSLRDNRSKYLGQIGYCPQFDAINELMTGEEMLNIFGQLKGLPPQQSQYQTDYWIKFLGLDEYRNRLCGTYSGGNKRKLSAAIALIGEPVIVFLDEPTSGVDPVARRKLWNVLARCQKGGQSIVLTSHSMDECEALCNRLTIMVQGQMKCIGNIQHLKHKYGQGFTIMIKLHNVEHNDNILDRLKDDIQSTFAPHCTLKDEHKGLLHYHISDASKPWSKLFQSMDTIKTRHPLVEDFVISETTLEQVFISFAKCQEKE
ncbi:phospholipid-transporting ATPase ABCA3-like isoform X2 [Lycorma delicatula]|uniref:phospholipid-transporting ATPase ABCA3-like isoform X2 n=1 Tax=Lycorma delicatula TaxID=130591 RepID=UPI003F50D7BA